MRRKVNPICYTTKTYRHKLSTIGHTNPCFTYRMGYFCVDNYLKRHIMANQKAALGDRIAELRKARGWSQSELAKKVGVSYTQMSRYEIKGVQPPADTINKLADTLGTSIDFLVGGNGDERARASIGDAELLRQFRAVEQFSDDDKSVVKKLIDAFIVKKQLQQLAS